MCDSRGFHIKHIFLFIFQRNYFPSEKFEDERKKDNEEAGFLRLKHLFLSGNSLTIKYDVTYLYKIGINSLQKFGSLIYWIFLHIFFQLSKF